MRPILSLCLAVALLGLAVPARAGLTAAELAQDNALLNQFNAIVFGNDQMGNEDEGRVAVGGTLTGGAHNIYLLQRLLGQHL
ncbi:MAG: collagen-binding domain-containing protein [Acetobacteraceae bacterium]